MGRTMYYAKRIQLITFIVDRRVDGEPWPTLQAYPKTGDRPWVQTYPYTQPIDLIEYCREFEYDHAVYTVNEYLTLDHSSRPDPDDTYYIVHIGWFDFALDYINLIDSRVIDLVKKNKFRILWYYHEGDSPKRIKQRLDALCELHSVNTNSYVFVTGNTAVDELRNFVHFVDHELLFYLRNKNDRKILKNSGSHEKVFTSLVRTHQWWRATALADLYRWSLLDNSYWSYNPAITVGNRVEDCPIEINVLNIADELNHFVQNGPYRADELTQAEHNDHSITYMPHYTNSSCNIIFETLFDADDSGGAFLSEKTFKPIKHGQPFVVVGCAGSLELLRDLGYCVFDGIIENTYDTVEDNTLRWLYIRETLRQIKRSDLTEFRARCREGVEHNQQVFLRSKWDRLNILFRKISNNDQ